MEDSGRGHQVVEAVRGSAGCGGSSEIAENAIRLWYNVGSKIPVVECNGAAGHNSASTNTDLISLADIRGDRTFFGSVQSSGDALLALAKRNAGREEVR